MALQWRVAHACNAAQGQLVEDELVVAADIVTSDGRVARGRIMGGRVQELDDGRLVFAASTGPHTSHLHCIVVSMYCCARTYKDGAGTIYHIGGGESDAVFEDGELVRYTQYRYPCRFGTAIDGRCVL